MVEREKRGSGVEPFSSWAARYSPKAGAVFEAVAGAAAGEPEVLDFGMAVDEEVAVGGVFVLADAGFG